MHVQHNGANTCAASLALFCQMTHICVNQMSHHHLGQWLGTRCLYSVPSHYLHNSCFISCSNLWKDIPKEMVITCNFPVRHCGVVKPFAPGIWFTNAIKITVCRLFGAKPLAEPVLTYCQLTPPCLKCFVPLTTESVTVDVVITLIQTLEYMPWYQNCTSSRVTRRHALLATRKQWINLNPNMDK